MVKYWKDGLEKKIDYLKQLNNATVTYGIFGDKAKEPAGDKQNITMGQLARIHEEGRTYRHPGGRVSIRNHAGEWRTFHIRAGTIITIPSRPFWTYANIIIRKSFIDVFERQLKLLFKNASSPDNMLKQIGIFCKQSVQESIIQTKFIPLSELQIWKKGHNQTLKDTGALLESVDYEVKKDKRYKVNL